MSQREELLGPYKAAASLSLGPISSTFYTVAARFQQIKLISQMDEETVTSSFLGGVTSSFPLCSLVFGSGKSTSDSDGGVVRCSWGQFHKSTGGVVDEDSEAYRGADFAIVLWLTEEFARIAIFQAKKVDLRDIWNASVEAISSDGADSSGLHALKSELASLKGKAILNVHRRPPRRGKPTSQWREAQMVRLVRTGHEVIQAHQHCMDFKSNWLELAKKFAQNPDKRKLLLGTDDLESLLKPLDWIHYLGYIDSDAVCVPLSAMSSDVLKKELSDTSFAINSVDLSTVEHHTFIDVLLKGVAAIENLANPNHQHVPGWKLVRAEVITQILPELQTMMAVYVGDETGSIGPSMMQLMDRQQKEGSFSGEVTHSEPFNDSALNETLEYTRRPTTLS